MCQKRDDLSTVALRRVLGGLPGTGGNDASVSAWV